MLYPSEPTRIDVSRGNTPREKEIMSPEVKAMLTLVFVIIVILTVAGTIVSGSIPPFFGFIIGLAIVIKVVKFIAKKRRGY